MCNRNYKDSVFVDLFARDVKAKENFISLYNALHDTHLDASTTEVKPVMLEKVLYMKYHNDVAMLVDGRIVVMIEHQSTINYNMPFRFLEYIARVYEKLVTTEERFGRRLVRLPPPEFYVFYNGKEDFPVESEMRLSDAFYRFDEDGRKKYDMKNYGGNGGFPLEITVKVININAEKDSPVLHRCRILSQYADFVRRVRCLVKAGVPDPLAVAIDKSVRQGILGDYLRRKSTEVRNMLIGEYDYDTDIAVQRWEARTEGSLQRAIEIAEKLLDKGIPVDVVADYTGLPLRTVHGLISAQDTDSSAILIPVDSPWGATVLFDEHDYAKDVAVQRNEVREDDSLQRMIEVANKLLGKGLSMDVVADCTGLPLEKVQELAASLG